MDSIALLESTRETTQITRFYAHVEQFSKINMLMALIMTLNMWSVDEPPVVCVRLFRRVFDVGGWYEALELDDTVHNLANPDFYYIMLIVDVFIYKNFRRVPQLLEIIETSGHILTNYAYCICMMLNPNRELGLQGLNRFKGIVGTGDGLTTMEWWRQKFCKDIYKIIDGLLEPDFNSSRFCQVHNKVTRFGERAIICYACCADHEMQCYLRHFEFHKAIEGL